MSPSRVVLISSKTVFSFQFSVFGFQFSALGQFSVFGFQFSAGWVEDRKPDRLKTENSKLETVLSPRHEHGRVVRFARVVAGEDSGDHLRALGEQAGVVFDVPRRAQGVAGE